MGNGQSGRQNTPASNQSKAKSKQSGNENNQKTASAPIIPAEPNFKPGHPIKHITHEASGNINNNASNFYSTRNVQPNSNITRPNQSLKPFTFNRYRKENVQPRTSMPNLENSLQHEKIDNSSPVQISSIPNTNTYNNASNGETGNLRTSIRMPNSNCEPSHSINQVMSSMLDKEISRVYEKKQAVQLNIVESNQLSTRMNKLSPAQGKGYPSIKVPPSKQLPINPKSITNLDPKVERQDLGTAQSTASSTGRKLKIRGLKTFVEKHHGGTPPLWVKEFPCRSKYHPDQYIYDFEEGPFAPKRPAIAMNQCPKKGGRCNNCGIYTSDICMRCRMCESDCSCKGTNAQVPLPENNMDYFGSSLNQARLAFDGLKNPTGPERPQPSQPLKWPEKQFSLSSEAPWQYPFNVGRQREQNGRSSNTQNDPESNSNSYYPQPSPNSFPYPPYPPGYMSHPYYPYPLPPPWSMYPPMPYPPSPYYPLGPGNSYYSPQPHQSPENTTLTKSPYNCTTKVMYNNSEPI